MTKFLRKLGAKEIFYAQRPFVIVCHIGLRSKFDLYANNYELLNRAINKWKQLYPLLRATIQWDETKPDELYFEEQSNQVESVEHENVQYLNFDPSASLHEKYGQDTEKLNADLVELLVEKELCEMIRVFDRDKGKLCWRMKVLSIENGNGDCFRYEMFLTYLHSINDGISAYYALKRLLDILDEFLSENQEKTLFEIDRLLPSAEILYEKQHDFSQDWNRTLKTKWPKFIDLDRAKKNSLNSKRFSSLFEFKEEQFYTKKNDESKWTLFSIENLLECSKLNANKFKVLTFEADKFSRIKQLCKEHEVKMMSFFSTLGFLAHQLWYERYNERLDECLVYTAVNLRAAIPHSDPDETFPISNYRMGSYAGATWNIFKPLSNDWSKNFWNSCKSNNDSLHARLKQGDVFRNYGRWNPPLEADEIIYPCGFTNIGSLKPEFKNKNIDIVEYLAFTNHATMSCNSAYNFNFICTLNYRINWSIRFNSHMVDIELIDELESLLQDCMEKILKN